MSDNIKIIDKSKLTPDNLPDVFYVKMWQGNNFYPCTRYTNNHDGTLTNAVRKYKESPDKCYWYEPDLWKGSVNAEQLIYTLTHMACLVSENEMTDDHVYDYE